MFDWKDFVFADWIPGIISILFFGFVVISIFVEITFKKACNTLIAKIDAEKEKGSISVDEADMKKRRITAIKTYGCLIIAVAASIFVALGAAKDGLLPGGVLLTSIWALIVYIAQYFGSLYAIKAIIYVWNWIKDKIANREYKPKRYKETREYTIDEHGNKTYIGG
jgi:hypothetical protein